MSKTTSDYIQIHTTVERSEDAHRIASILVENHLAACVQIEGPISSSYRWEGAVQTADEWRCTIKTRLALFDQVETALRAIHPYTLPEIIAIPLLTGNYDYLDWIDDATRTP